MAEVLLFHHALGLTDGVLAFADGIRTAGHTVHVPDLFEGARFDDVAAGVAHARGLGFDAILARGRRAAEALPEALVYVGFSLGAMPTQLLAQTRTGAVGAVLLHGCLPASAFSDDGWPTAVPVQVHGGDRDPYFAGEDLAAARTLVADAPDAELVLYPTDAHLFTDATLAEHDPELSRELSDRVLAFLDRLTAR